MKQYLRYVDYAFWFPIVALQCLVFVLAIRRRLAKSLPRFLTFCGFVATRSLCLLAISQLFSYRVYFWFFYAGLAIEVILLFLIIYEIFDSAFSPMSSLPHQAIPSIVAIFCVLLSATLAWGIWKPAARPHYPWVTDLLNTMDRSTGIVVACALWTIVMYARHLGIPWRARAGQIARGFLLNLSIQAITVTGIGFANFQMGMWFSRIGMAGNIAALVIWLRAVRQQEVAVVLPPPEALARLQSATAQMRSVVARLRRSPAAAPGLRISEE